MSISLILTKSYDRELNKTGLAILEQEWQSHVESDDQLTFRTEPLIVELPDGTQVSMAPALGQSEFTMADGTTIPFLALTSSGELSMRFHPTMDNPDDPVRIKFVECV